MKQIIRNKYIRSFSFKTYQELLTFVGNQGIEKILTLGETSGENFYCYVCYNSLTQEKSFVITFSSDEDENNLNLLVWNESQLLAVDTGKNIYLIGDKLNLKTSLEITTPLVGLHITNNNELLILEEASLRIVNSQGDVLRSELFDLIDSLILENDVLSIETSEGNKTFNLIG